MSYLIAELFERHDRDCFEVFRWLHHPRRRQRDPPARASIGAFDHFRTSIRLLSDEAAARRIREDEIDILIDPNGLTAGSRLQILRWRPAPLQATYLGFIGPVPLPELDYLFCDSIVIPPSVAGSYAPQPQYIAEIYQANDSKRSIGAPITRAQAGLPEDRFIFCYFSNHYKITEEMFVAWLEILRRARPRHGLIADNVWSCVNLRLRAAAAGIGPERIIYAGRISPADYMARMVLADLFLDTSPYNAGTIASDAIRMGLPLVTLSGESFASRMAGRLLAAIGADRGIATTRADYIETAVALATDPTRPRRHLRAVHRGPMGRDHRRHRRLHRRVRGHAAAPPGRPDVRRPGVRPPRVRRPGIRQRCARRLMRGHHPSACARHHPPPARARDHA